MPIYQFIHKNKILSKKNVFDRINVKKTLFIQQIKLINNNMNQSILNKLENIKERIELKLNDRENYFYGAF